MQLPAVLNCCLSVTVWKKFRVHTAGEIRRTLEAKFEAWRHFLSKKCARLMRGDVLVKLICFHSYLLVSPWFFPPNMSSSSALTSCSPYWLSSVFHKQARLHFKGNDLCPLKWMNEGPYLCLSELRSAAACYFGLMCSSTLNNTHDYYYHGSFAATHRRGALIYSCDHCKTYYKI